MKWSQAAIEIGQVIHGYELEENPAFEQARERVRTAEREEGQWEGPAIGLWMQLFHECRANRHHGFDPEGEPLERLDALCRALRAKLVEEMREHGKLEGVTVVPYRAALKIPRDLRVLDPACGSGHFLLYAFDLLITIYEEGWNDGAVKSEATGRTLRDDYPEKAALYRALPGLILAHNLHGVDIDPRCAQIAQLALWMRAQRGYKDLEVPAAERPMIRRSNIVVAEPLATDDETLKEFVEGIRDPALARVFKELVETLKLAGDFGVAPRVEELVSRGPKKG